MADQTCPKCKTTSYQNPHMKLMINICGHSICENCVARTFDAKSGKGFCPVCHIPLRKKDYKHQVFEDSMVDREVHIRKKVLKDFNMQREDFDTLLKYNDYLEEVEKIVYNVVNDVDKEATKKMMENYKKENRDQIMKGRSRVSREQQELEVIVAAEVDQRTRLGLQSAREEERLRERRRNKEALMDELMMSEAPAGDIVSVHQERMQEGKEQEAGETKLQTFSTGIRMEMGAYEGLRVVEEEGQVYRYSPLELEHCGLLLPKSPDLNTAGYEKNMRDATEAEAAAGFTSLLAVKRALGDMFNSLFFHQGPGGRVDPFADPPAVAELEVS